MTTATRQLAASRNYHERRYLDSLRLTEGELREVESLVSQEFLRHGANMAELLRRNPAAYHMIADRMYTRRDPLKWQDAAPLVIRELEALDRADEQAEYTELRNQ